MAKSFQCVVTSRLTPYLVIIFLFSISFSCFQTGDVFAFDDIRLLQPAIAYQPRGFSPEIKSSILSPEQIKDDLQLLFDAGFRSLVTYSSAGTMGDIPKIARNSGFDGNIIMGIWDPFSSEEWNNAIRNASIVDGYCLGNEGLDVRYTPKELAIRMRRLRRLTSKPVTTSEPIDAYISGPHRGWLLEHSDWLFPIAHPYWAKQPNPEQAVDWLIARYDFLVASTGRVVILKEAGFPSVAPFGEGERLQLAFFQLLEPMGISFFYFEAFDQPWKGNALKQHEVEAHWGLYQADGTPKKVIPWLMENRKRHE